MPIISELGHLGTIPHEPPRNDFGESQRFSPRQNNVAARSNGASFPNDIWAKQLFFGRNLDADNEHHKLLEGRGIDESVMSERQLSCIILNSIN